jgi:hypothetical protein
MISDSKHHLHLKPMMNFFAKAPKHTNASTFDISFFFFECNMPRSFVTPIGPPPQTHTTQCFPTSRPRWEELLDLSQHHETFEVHVIVRLH